MKQVPDRKKLREYLRKKGRAYASSAVYSMLLVPAIFVAALCGLSAIYALASIVVALYSHRPSASIETVAMILLSFIVGGVASAFAYFCYHSIKEAHRAADVAFVSPLAPDALPADEILVRGSEQPPEEQSEVLLRAAKGEETPKDELLRVSQE